MPSCQPHSSDYYDAFPPVYRGKMRPEKLGDFCKVAHLIEWQRWEPKDLAVILCCIRELACYHAGRNSSLSPRASFPLCGPLPSRSIILITV